MRDKCVFICVDGIFPYGTAGANRVLNIAKALKQKRMECVILGLSNDGNIKGCIDGIRYECTNIGQTKKITSIYRKVIGGRVLARYLTGKLHTGDIVYIYGSKSTFVGPLFREAQKVGAVSVLDVVEWHQPFQYRAGVLSLGYLSANWTFSRLAPKIHNIVAISSVIENYYQTKGCHTLICPPIVDSQSVTPFEKSKNAGVLRFIYPGVPFGKDDIDTMIKGISLLSEREKTRFEFHITGITEEQLRKKTKLSSDILSQVRGQIYFHGKMKYDDLRLLYCGMDFLYLSRPQNRLTQANFPSKVPELMCYGVIPICNRVGDYTNYLNDNSNALLFDKNLPEECAKVLKRALTLSFEEKEKMSNAARKCVEESLDCRKWSDIIADYLLFCRAN